ncbi:MAG: DUF58 domain-containing protein [Polyangiaceae bacterium]|nr:DUF58 domain-containing protein [Polyangiaceae bacterium]
MAWLDLLRRRRRPSSRERPEAAALFDDDFQRRLESLALVSRRVFAGRLRAERRTRKKGSGVEFADHRDYVPGDDFRAVDWNVYQRFGRLLVRLHEEEEDLSIHLLLDRSESMGFGGGKKLAQAKRLVAALAYVGLAHLDRVGIVALDDRVARQLPPTRGKGRIFRVFRFLAGIEAGGRTDLGEALRTFVAQHRRRGLAVLVSDLYDPAGFERGINTLRYHGFEPYVLHVVDRADARPDVSGDVRVQDCETGDEREVTVTAPLLEKLGRAWVDYQAEIAHFCLAHRVPYLVADADLPFDEIVLRVLRRGGFLR